MWFGSSPHLSDIPAHPNPFAPPQASASDDGHAARVNGWDVELIVARDDREQRAAARDTVKGLFRRVRNGIYVAADDVVELRNEELHLIAMRALASSAKRPVVFSHWSAAVARDDAVIGNHLSKPHITVEEPGDRYFERVVSHVFDLREEEIEEVGGLLVVTRGRAVVDIAAAGTFTEGVVTADAALASGLSRELLERAVDLAGPRRSWRKVTRVVEFADGDSGSAGESVSRVTMDELGLRPVLQHRLYDRQGLIGKGDFYFPEDDVIGEFDGLIKFLDPRFAPQGAGRKAYDEKVREDRGRRVTRGWGRWGWAESWSARLLGDILRIAGVRIPRPVR